MDDDFDVDDIDVDAIVARHHALEQKAHQKLREHWGHTEFRANQLDALQAVLRGQDCLVVMATGSGKSLCYQLVPLVTGVPAVVVSPLIALMQDQVLALQARGVRAVLLGSAQADRTAEARAMAGEYDVKFGFQETIALTDGYETWAPYESGATELVLVVADEGNHIVLQHLRTALRGVHVP